MEDIPRWIKNIIKVEKLKCRNCDKLFNVGNLMSIGIQESSKMPNRDSLCIGMFCGECHELIIFEIKEMSLLDFSFDILDQEKNKNNILLPRKLSKKKTSRRRVKKSKITLKEVEEIREFLSQKGLKHEEFLVAMGMSPEEIREYDYKKKGTEK